jgi:DNA-binding LacI/PurR family transcriptional regulator
MSSLKDVSALAGVNVSTVSRYLSGKLTVRKETEDRIKEAIRALDYRPNSVARALKLRRTGTVGIIVPNSANPVFAEIVSGVYRVLSDYGYAYIQTASENDKDRELTCFQQLQERQVDGILAIGSARPGDRYEQWVAEGAIRKTPTVFINRFYDQPHTCGCSPTLPGEPAGRRNTACSGAGEGSPWSRAFPDWRRRRSRSGDTAGAWPATAWRWSPARCSRASTAMRRATGRGYLLKLFQPDAILAVNDLAAIAALNCALDMGLRVPEDLAVIGFGNSETAAFTSPGLTTVEQHKAYCGQRGAQKLIDLLEGKRPVSEMVETELVLRGSV